MNEHIKRQWLEVRARLKDKGISQQTLASIAGVSQATVSRVLQRCPERHGGAFRKLCVYAETLRPEDRGKAPAVNNEDLLSALGDVWNGTPEHARALAAMIRAAGAAARLSKL